jgi:hypothetical protein
LIVRVQGLVADGNVGHAIVPGSVFPVNVGPAPGSG